MSVKMCLVSLVCVCVSVCCILFFQILGLRIFVAALRLRTRVWYMINYLELLQYVSLYMKIQTRHTFDNQSNRACKALLLFSAKRVSIVTFEHVSAVSGNFTENSDQFSFVEMSPLLASFHLLQIRGMRHFYMNL